MTPSVTVGVVDYGFGNVHSVRHALQSAGAVVALTGDAAVLDACDGLVVPGVGAFAACMAGLRAIGADRLIRAWAERGRPVLGICVGHQVMFERGVEHGRDTAGIGLLPGAVERLASARLPHMGWNVVAVPSGSRLFAGVERRRFYFVHSYGVHDLAPDPGVDRAVTWCEHGCDRFVAAVERGALTCTQFHPEKSGDAGARLLRNWLDDVAALAAAGTVARTV